MGEFFVGISAARELPKGFIVTAGPSYRWRDYDRPIAAFGTDARRDRTLSGQIKVSKPQCRDIRIHARAYG